MLDWFLSISGYSKVLPGIARLDIRDNSLYVYVVYLEGII